MKTQVLDFGYVELIEPWGHGRAGGRDDQNTDFEVGIIEAARQSTQASFRGWEPAACDCGLTQNDPDIAMTPHPAKCASVKNPGDRKLLKFLNDNKHSTPFEFAGGVWEIQAPILVFREWRTHRIGSYSEASARYAPLPELYYLPTIERLLLKEEGSNKQAAAMKDSMELTPKNATWFREELARTYGNFSRQYKDALHAGVPKELARCGMPVAMYSKMRVAMNLRSCLHFMTLRCDPKAQWEIRQFAHTMSDMVEKVFPNTHALWAAAREK